MAGDNTAPEADALTRADAHALNTDGRVLAYLRAVMLASGDDPNVMAVAINIVEGARAGLQRREALRVTASAIDLNCVVKQFR